jgi:hypothetical protein
MENFYLFIILNDIFPAYCILGLKILCSSAWNTYLHTLLILKFMLRNLLLFWWVYFDMLFLYFSLTAFNILFDLCGFFLRIICCREILFWLSLFGVLQASCTWMGYSFSWFEKFSAIISLNILCALFLVPLCLL